MCEIDLSSLPVHTYIHTFREKERERETASFLYTKHSHAYLFSSTELFWDKIFCHFNFSIIIKELNFMVNTTLRAQYQVMLYTVTDRSKSSAQNYATAIWYKMTNMRWHSVCPD